MIELLDKGYICNLIMVNGLEKKSGRLKDFNRLGKHSFNESLIKVLNFTDVSNSLCFNPIQHKYIPSIQSAIVLSEKLINCIFPISPNSNYDNMIKEASINFLAACIYFFVNYKKQPYDDKGNILYPEYFIEPYSNRKFLTGRVFESVEYRNRSVYNGKSYRNGVTIPNYWLGKYSDMPHVLSFLNFDYKTMFEILETAPEIYSLIVCLKSALLSKHMGFLEEVFSIIRILSCKLDFKESFWILSKEKEDFDLFDNKKPVNVITILNKDNISLLKILSVLITDFKINDIIESVSNNYIAENLLNAKFYGFDSNYEMERILLKNYFYIKKETENLINEIMYV